MTVVSWLSFRVERHRAERLFRHLQLVSAGLYSLGHGTNDAQKTMGIIVALLAAAGHNSGRSRGHIAWVHVFGGKHEIAWWIILSCHTAMALGTMAGGWRIVQTVGSRITPHLRPIGGFSAELAAATTIGMATMAQVPISTTHAIGGAVSGVGATRGWHAVRWIWGETYRLCLDSDLSRSSSHRGRRLLAITLGHPAIHSLIRFGTRFNPKLVNLCRPGRAEAVVLLESTIVPVRETKQLAPSCPPHRPCLSLIFNHPEES